MTNFIAPEELNRQGKTLDDVGLGAEQPAVRRGSDGYIDLGYYLDRGRQERAKAARSIFGGLARAIRKLVAGAVDRRQPRRGRLHHV